MRTRLTVRADTHLTLGEFASCVTLPRSAPGLRQYARVRAPFSPEVRCKKSERTIRLVDVGFHAATFSDTRLCSSGSDDASLFFVH